MAEQEIRRTTGHARGAYEEAADNAALSGLVELATVGITRADTGSGRISYANDAFCRMVGYSDDELSQGKLCFVELTHPDDRAKNIALHKSFIAGQLPHYAVEKRYIRKDGTCVWARTIVTRMKSVRPGTDETFTVILDITHEIEARERERTPAAAEAPSVRSIRLGLEEVDRYILEYWDRPLTVGQLSEIANLPRRSFFTNFRRLHGTSPNRYIKRLRLGRARQLLMCAGQNDTVSSIAARCAFANLGHFAKDYKRCYGELPSETLKKHAPGQWAAPAPERSS